MSHLPPVTLRSCPVQAGPSVAALACRVSREPPIGGESLRSAGHTDHIVGPRNAISAIGTDVEPSGHRSARWYETTQAEVPGRAGRFPPFLAAGRRARQGCSARDDPVDPHFRSRVSPKDMAAPRPRPLGRIVVCPIAGSVRRRRFRSSPSSIAQNGFGGPVFALAARDLAR
jgi:hypothetical protein